MGLEERVALCAADWGHLGDRLGSRRPLSLPPCAGRRETDRDVAAKTLRNDAEVGLTLCGRKRLHRACWFEGAVPSQVSC